MTREQTEWRRAAVVRDDATRLGIAGVKYPVQLPVLDRTAAESGTHGHMKQEVNIGSDNSIQLKPNQRNYHKWQSEMEHYVIMNLES